MTAREIYQSMLLEFTARTGRPLDGGCDLAVRLYAAASQLETLYQYADWSRKQAFPQTADGQYLDWHGQMHGLSRRQSTKAVGPVQVRLSEAQPDDLLFEAGSSLYAGGNIEVILQSGYTLPAGVTRFYATVEAASAGSRGNLPLGTRFQFSDGPACVESVVATDALTGGLDTETDEAFRQRILESFRPGANGANTASYKALALSVEHVAACSVISGARGPLTMDLVITDRDGMPTEEQLIEVETLVIERRELGIDLQVLEPTAVQMDVDLVIRLKDGVSLTEASFEIGNLLRNWFNGSLLGKPVYDAEITHLVFSTGLVRDCVTDTDHSGESIGPDELPILADLNITEAV